MSADDIKKYMIIVESKLIATTHESASHKPINEYFYDGDDGDGDDEGFREAKFQFRLRGITYQGIVRLFPEGEETTVKYDLNGMRYTKVMDTSTVTEFDDFIQHAKDFIQEINMLKGDGDHFVEEIK